MVTMRPKRKKKEKKKDNVLLLTEQLTRVKEPMIWGNALSNVDYCVFVLFFPFFLFALLPRICVPKGRGVLLGRKWSRYIPRCVLCRALASSLRLVIM